MSLSEAVANVAAESGYTVDSTIIGSTDVTTKQLLAIAQRVNKEMSDQFPWPIFYASGSITLVAGQASYQLPAAFSHYLFETFWNQSTRWRVLGPMTPQEYAEIQGYGLNPTVYQRFQFRGISNDQLLISPTPGAQNDGDTIIFEYIADRSVRPATWAASTFYAAGAYTFYNGNYYKTTSGGTSGSTAPTHTSGSASDGGVTWVYYSGAYSKFLADTDEPLLNQKTLEQGMIERFAEIHELNGIKPRFDIQLAEDFSRQNPGKLLFAGGDSRQVLFARSGVAIFGTWI